MDTNENVFWRVILSSPNDPLPRMIYADWLADRGDYERAAAVRADAHRVAAGKEIRLFSDMLGQYLVKIEGVEGDGEMSFTTACGEVYRLYHDQECCESVSIEDVAGDVNDLVGSPLTLCEETSSTERQPWQEDPSPYDDSFTWTFYRMATVKGYVTVRFLGESNGYYSESVDFKRVTPP